MRPWTPEEDAKVLDYSKSAATWSLLLNRSADSVRSHRYFLRNSEQIRTRQRKNRQVDPARRSQYRQRNYKKGASHQTNAHRHWSSNEDCAIIANDRPTDRKLSAQLDRTVQAIQTRRTKLVRQVEITATKP